METDYDYLFEVSWDEGQDVIYIDTGNDAQVYLTRSDLESMLDALGGV